MHWLKVLDSPLPVIVNSHLPAAIRSVARRGGVAARRRLQSEMRRRVRLRSVVDFMPGAYIGIGMAAWDRRRPQLWAAVRRSGARRRAPVGARDACPQQA